MPWLSRFTNAELIGKVTGSMSPYASNGGPSDQSGKQSSSVITLMRRIDTIMLEGWRPRHTGPIWHRDPRRDHLPTTPGRV